jgi:hypothetical protein
MAGTTIRNKAWSTDPDKVAEHNRFIDDLELLRARINAICIKLDADATVSGTDYVAGAYGGTTAISSAAVLLAAKVGTVVV